MECSTAFVTVRGINWPDEVESIRYPHVTMVWSDKRGIQLIAFRSLTPFRVVNPDLYYVGVTFHGVE